MFSKPDEKAGGIGQMHYGKDLNELKARFSSIPKELDIVNIGSGPSFYDFDWSAVPGISGYNLAVAPEDFRYDARILKYYGNHVKKGGIVVVVVCPLSFVKNDYLYKDSFSEKYVFILPTVDVDLPKWKYMLYRYCPFVLKGKNLVQIVIRRMRKKLVCKRQIPLSPTEELVKRWILDNEYLTNLKDSSQAEYYLDTFLEKRRDLRTVLNTCYKKKFRPVIVLPPMSNDLRQNISDSFIQRFVYDNLKEMVIDDTPILDYIDDARFNDVSNYTNGLFLTQKMRKVFTNTVWDEIGKVLL